MKRSFDRGFNSFADSLVAFSHHSGRKTWLLFLLIFSLSVVLLFPFPGYSQRQLTDLQGNWGQACIQQLAQRQIVSGYPDGRFQPNQSVTRTEFAAILNKAFADSPNVRSGGNFTDVPGNFWGRGAIRAAFERGFLSGYPNGIFRPNENISRTQILVAIASGLKYAPTQPVEATLNAAFADAATIPNYAEPKIAAAVEKGLIVNYPNPRQLHPNRAATRGEVAAFVCQAIGVAGVPSQYIVGANLAETKPELRGVWLTNVDSDVLFSQPKLTGAIARLKQLNFNTLYPTVWNWGYTLYPSQIMEREIGIALDPEPGLQGRDMLKEIVEQGHDSGMAVIPWFEFGFMAPADSELAKQHPEWLTQRRNGETIWVEGGVHDRVWLNPLRPDVREFITALAVELVSRYDVDGIQFDDHFGYPSDFGYDEFTVALYQKEHNGQSPPAEAKDPEWIRWRADKITDYMRQLFVAVKAARSDVLISLSPNPQEFSLESYLLDWQTWERLGLIEELIVQVYRNDLDRFSQELAHSSLQQAKTHIPVAVGILSGLKGRYVPLEQIERQVQVVRDRGFAGMSFFFYESLWNYANETPSQRQAALGNLFRREVKRPSLSENWQPASGERS